MSATAAQLPSREIHVALREARLVTERVLLWLGLPAGFVPAMREGILVSQAMGLGGFDHLLTEHGRLSGRDLGALQIVQEGPSRLELDGGGLHAWLLAPTLTDLAVDFARRMGRCEITISNVDEAAELAIIGGLGRRHGAVADVRSEVSGTTRIDTHNTSPPRSLEQWDPLLAAAMRDRYTIREANWRALYDLSNRALAPDSVLSRRHAGPVILLDDGTVIGRHPADDDFDPRMLQVQDPRKVGAPI